MNTSADNLLGEEQIDALKEIINIAFGEAAASLSDVIGLHAILNVPQIKILPADEIQKFIVNEIGAEHGFHVIEQHYSSKFKGVAFLLFSSESGKMFISLLEGNEEVPEYFTINLLEKETLTEVGNIIIGACVGKIAELLSDVVTYMPPRCIDGKVLQNDIPKSFWGNGYAVILKTLFKFELSEVYGYLFLVINVESIEWLKKAINKFANRYE